ncbi:MAG: branched-chain amino acid ABC transporter permease [Elioraea sp.]|nr:branched-chain amino acid ABC transporter permease [Elioraea sp.]
MDQLLQFVFSGLTVGAVYALVALGFTFIYNASDVINFAQGEFVMLGGMVTVFAYAAGVPLPLAAMLAVVTAVVTGLALHRFAIEPARGANAVTLIIITIGASILIRGIAQIVFDKQFHRFPAFSGEDPIAVLGATILPQSLWVLGGAAVVVAGLWLFMEKTLLGKAVRATAANRLAARLVGIDTAVVLALAFGVSGAIGALAGILVTPITLTSVTVGTLLALKGFAAAMLVVFVIAAIYAALAGSLLALFNRFVTPQVADFLHSIELVTMVVIGGMGSTLGAIVGAAILTVLPQALTVFHDYEHAVLGLMVILFMIFLRQGIVPGLASLLPRRVAA